MRLYLFTLLSLFLLLPPPARGEDRTVKFNRDIRPILSETCFHCHGSDEHGRCADLRLDTLACATEDLGGTVAITPGDLKASEAWWRIIADDPEERMPLPESHLVLTEEQKQLIKRWSSRCRMRSEKKIIKLPLTSTSKVWLVSLS